MDILAIASGVTVGRGGKCPSGSSGVGPYLEMGPLIRLDLLPVP